jgi:hypothetical protein
MFIINSMMQRSNPLSSKLEIDENIYVDAGISGLWRVHPGTIRTSSKQCSIFIFDKKQVMKLNPLAKQEFILRDFGIISESLKLEVNNIIYIRSKF